MKDTITKLKLFFLFVACPFITKISLGQSAPTLGTSSSFALFTAVGAFSNIGAATTVTGDVGTNAGAFTAFPPGTLVGAKHVVDATSAQAATDVATAYSYLDGLTCDSVIGTTLGSGQILTPKIYCLGAASTLNGDLILDGQGDPDALFIFKINGTLSTATFSNIILINSASLCNVYWQINGAFSLGDGSVFRGTIVADGAISLLEGSSLFGRGLSTAGAIDLHNNIVALGMQPVATIAAVGNATICSGNSETLNATVTNGVAPFSYLWIPGGQTTSSITVSPTVTTTYTVAITAINGCSPAIAAFVVTVNQPATVDAGSGQTICAGSAVTLAGSVGGGASGGTWSGGTGTFSPDANTPGAVYTPSAADIAAGTVTLTLTTNDPAGPCSSATDQMVITISPSPAVDLGNDTTAIFCTGSIVLDAGNQGSTYLWSTDATSQTITVNSTGTYYVTVTNGNCTVSDTIHVTVLPDLTVDLGNGAILCAGGSITLDGGNQGATYLWSTGATSQTIIVNSTGTYYVTVTKGNCVVSDTINVTVLPVLNVDLGNDTTAIFCTGSIVLDAGNQGSTYLWSTGATSQTITVNSTGTYYVTVTNGNCTVSDTIHVTVLPDLTVDLGNGAILCAGGSITLDAGNQGSTYLWSTGATSQTITVNSTGTYYVTVTKGNCVVSDTVNVTVLPVLNVDLGNDTVITTCKDDSLLLDAGATGSTYLWSTGATTQTIYVSTSGTYFVNVTNQGGCTASDIIYVVIHNTVHVNFGPDTTVCGCILLNAYNTGASYQWCAGESYAIRNICTTGMYCVTVSNGFCRASDTINIIVNQPPVVHLGNDTTIIGSLVLNAGNANSSFNWSTGDTTQMVTIDSSGTYFVTVTNSFGCSSTDTIHVTVITGINENSGTQNLRMYPNPTTGTFVVTTSMLPQRIIVTDVLGKEVFSVVPDNSTTIINLHDQMNGMYFVRIISDKSQITKRITISK